jgi:transposase InsO family protein
MLTVIDEFTRRCLAIPTARSLKSDDVLACLTELFTIHGPPDHIRSDNGSEFTANMVREWLQRINVKTLFITPGSPWENGYNESFNGKLPIARSNTDRRRQKPYCLALPRRSTLRSDRRNRAIKPAKASHNGWTT